jgi:hypothetical protein
MGLPAWARAGMAGVARAVVTDCELDRQESGMELGPDSVFDAAHDAFERSCNFAVKCFVSLSFKGCTP